MRTVKVDAAAVTIRKVLAGRPRDSSTRKTSPALIAPAPASKSVALSQY